MSNGIELSGFFSYPNGVIGEIWTSYLPFSYHFLLLLDCNICFPVCLSEIRALCGVATTCRLHGRGIQFGLGPYFLSLVWSWSLTNGLRV